MRTFRRLLIVLAVAGPVVGLLLGLVANLAASQDQWPGALDVLRRYPWHAMGVLFLASIALGILAAIVDREPSTPIDLGTVADRLAIAVRRQWLYEAEWRRLYDPYPMPVRWSSAAPDLMADWSTLTALATSGAGWRQRAATTYASGPSDLVGTGSDLAGILDTVPTSRLVVLGDRGSGKTILLVRLILDLLDRRADGGPVPVLLPLASWNPVDQDLRAWIEQWLTTDNPALAENAPDRTGETRARALLAAGLITPILDGFDEIPNEVRATAISRINEAIQPNQRLVLASRLAEYRTAVQPSDRPGVQLIGAAGIELSPLEPEVVDAYLRASAGGPSAAKRWEDVLYTIKNKPSHPVSKALATPLMAALARAVYNPRPDEALSAILHEPAELLDSNLFPSRQSVEEHLFDRFIPAAYRPHPDKSRACRWSTVQVQRWLVYLARDLEVRQRGATDIAWWRLKGAAPAALSGAVVGILAFVAGAIGLPFPGFGLGLIAAISTAYLLRAILRSTKRRITLGLAGGILGGQLAALTVAFVLGLGTGEGAAQFASLIGGGLAVGISISPISSFRSALLGGFVGETVIGIYEHDPIFETVRIDVGSWANVINGVGLGLAAGVAAGLAVRRGPAKGLRWSWLGCLCGVVTGVAAGFITWIQVGQSAGLFVGAAVTIAGSYGGGFFFEARETDLTKETNPRSVLRRDRVTFVTSCVGLGTALALGSGLTMALGPDPVTGLPGGVEMGLRVGLANIVAAGLAFGFLQASWGSYFLARIWLATSGLLPWRLMPFLADAHQNRGVLRQVGAIYQFRHIELQRRLGSAHHSH